MIEVRSEWISLCIRRRDEKGFRSDGSLRPCSVAVATAANAEAEKVMLFGRASLPSSAGTFVFVYSEPDLWTGLVFH